MRRKKNVVFLCFHVFDFSFLQWKSIWTENWVMCVWVVRFLWIVKLLLFLMSFNVMEFQFYREKIKKNKRKLNRWILSQFVWWGRRPTKEWSQLFREVSNRWRYISEVNWFDIKICQMWLISSLISFYLFLLLSF